MEVFGAGVWLQYYADLEILRQVIQDDDAARVEVAQRPLGVVAAISCDASSSADENSSVSTSSKPSSSHPRADLVWSAS